MMKSILRHSLPLHAWAAVFTIAILCIFSALGSGMLAWVSSADAQAINSAGSIRMATYRINFQLANDFDEDYLAVLDMSLAADDSANQNSDQNKPATVLSLVEDMENRLANLREYQLYYANQHEIINSQLDKIETQWFDNLKPTLLAADKNSFYAVSSQYISDVDSFVSALQYRNEQRQFWQQSLQVASLTLTIIIMLIGMYNLRHNVLLPVQQLIRANSRFKRGEHDTRVSISGYREFNKLGDSFNDMAKTIESHQSSLENEVQIKTEHLTIANQVLALFYDFSKSIASRSVSLHRLDELISDFGNIFPHLDFTLCIQNEVLNDKVSIALHDDKMKELCTKLNCNNCLIKEDVHTKIYPLTHQDLEFGELKVRPKSMLSMRFERSTQSSTSAAPNNSNSSQRIKTVEIDSSYLNAENSDLIAALTNLISTALSLRRQRQQDHQLILLEERSTMARELHDSLAQSLSYLKIQVSVLERHLKMAAGEQNDSNILQSIHQLKKGLNSAYQSLRDLLVTFRLTINSDNFDDALREAADEFASRGRFDITVSNRVMTLNLSAIEQVDLIQIAREALSNISRHAQAEHVAIDLSYSEDKYIVMTISDDGIGISSSGTVDQTQHHGLMIMKERAHNLGGNLIIAANEPTGTRITVKFLPNFFNGSLNEADKNSMTNESL